MKRRQFLGLTGVGLLGVGAEFYFSDRQEKLDNPLGVSDERLDSGDFWTVSVIPDTQNYVSNEEWLKHVENQVDWITENRDRYNIAFVTHEGDLVNNGASQEQWDRIDSALEPLQGEVPYSVVPGNHDWSDIYDKSSGIEEYLSRFSSQRFEDRDWYDESGPNDLSHAQVFSGGDMDFLHLGLEWEPRDNTVQWADQKIDEYSLPTIVTTHSHLHKGVTGTTRMGEVKEEGGEGNSGEEIFQELIYPNDEVFMVLSGHSFGGLLPRNRGEHHQISENQEEQPVYEMLTDYQNRKNGGNGWMRNITFLPEENGYDSISVSTYSPSTGMNQVGSSSDFRFHLDFDERF